MILNQSMFIFNVVKHLLDNHFMLLLAYKINHHLLVIQTKKKKISAVV